MATIQFDARTKRQRRNAWVSNLEKNWLHLLILGLALHILFNKDITIELNLHSTGQIGEPLVIRPIGYRHPAQGAMPEPVVELSQAPSVPIGEVTLPRADQFSNLTFILNPSLGRRKNVDPRIIQQKRENCLAYVEHFTAMAQREKDKYGIPVSITLAQGLLESDAGASRLARESNNHFGIKCRAKCRGCTCRNYTDDDIYDMFRVFSSPRESFREHSLLLSSKRYSHLKKLPVTDYRNWAHGLKKAGYATDKNYATKLIRIIEALDLDRYDRETA